MEGFGERNMKVASKMIEIGKVNVGIKDNCSELGMTIVGRALLAREGRVRQNSLWKVVPQMGEARNRRVQVYSQPQFWKVNEDGVTGRTHASYSC